MQISHKFALALCLATPVLHAQQLACRGERVSGIVVDGAGDVIPGATITLDGTLSNTSDNTGRYSFSCIPAGSHTLHADAKGFASSDTHLRMGSGSQSLNLKMIVKGDDVSIDVSEDPSTGIDNQNAGGSKTLQSKDLAQMADDPDDFKRELQVLAAAGGGTPGAATISVDGFQGDAPLPPKGSIAFIRVNPDLFSAEYGNPPYEGGRIEIYTKPGQNKLHGALFITDSPTFLNARDPFAPTRAALGKQRYGFELTGGIIPNKQDFSLNMEKRDIDNFAVINAYTSLDSAGNPVITTANVPQSQHLWIASARSGIQINQNNLATLTYQIYRNSLQNVGAGGTMLQQASYNQTQTTQSIYGVLISTLSPRLVHEMHVAFTLQRNDNTPNATGPSINVAGYFTGGGSSAGYLKAHENHLEFDDDVLYNRGKHSIKAGVLSFSIFQRNSTPTLFNGQYYFAGCSPTDPVSRANCPGQTQALNALQQYFLALNGRASATTYSVTTGTPEVNLNMSRNAFYIQDQYKLNGHLQLSGGLRWAIQNDPSAFQAVSPRFGLAWSPDKKQKLVLRARVGMFASPIATSTTSEVMRLNGSRQVQALYYGTTMQNPTAATSIGTQRLLAPHIQQGTSLQSHFAVEYAFPHGWNVQANVYPVRGWNLMRTRNINQPLDDSATGPRPITPNVNLLQFQQTGHFRGHVEFFGLDQHNYRSWQLFVGYLHMDFTTNSDGPTTQPQFSNSDAGEFSRPTWQASHRIFVIGSITLPEKIQFTTNFDAESGSPFNITTSTDNNGDGTFNDRPVYVAADTAGAVHTRYGWMMNSATGGNYIARNLGTMPWTVHMDSNLSRAFKLRKASSDQQKITVNLRAANLLNHTNVSSVGSVLSTGFQIGTPYAAETGRRVEAGLRYTF